MRSVSTLGTSTSCGGVTVKVEINKTVFAGGVLVHTTGDLMSHGAPIAATNTTVFIQGSPVVAEKDVVAPHTPDLTPHKAVVEDAGLLVFIP